MVRRCNVQNVFLSSLASIRLNTVAYYKSAIRLTSFNLDQANYVRMSHAYIFSKDQFCAESLKV